MRIPSLVAVVLLSLIHVKTHAAVLDLTNTPLSHALVAQIQGACCGNEGRDHRVVYLTLDTNSGNIFGRVYLQAKHTAHFSFMGFPQHQTVYDFRFDVDFWGQVTWQDGECVARVTRVDVPNDVIKAIGAVGDVIGRVINGDAFNSAIQRVLDETPMRCN